MNEDNFYIGRIVKIHGFKGEVVLRLDTDIPEAYEQMESLFLQRAEAMVPFFIRRSSLSGQFLRMKLEGVDTEEEARRLVRSEAYLPMECLPELKEGQFYYHEITGYRVLDKTAGEIGTVKRVNDAPVQPLFEIDFHGTEILVPVVDNFIEKVDKKARILYLNLPEGLLDIYTKD